MADSPVVTVFQDRQLLILDKPHGVDSQELYKQLRDEHAYLGMHHRLDQPASGLLLFTLDQRVNAAIAAAFRNHTIARTYRAVLMGEATDDVWQWPLEGQAAQTTVAVLSVDNGMSAVECTLATGRTHQIRKHAAMAGVPVAGDRRYAQEAGRAWPRLALHACRLAFTHPKSGRDIVCESEIPADLSQLWGLAASS